MQKEYEVNYKNSVKNHFRIHRYQKYFTLAGAAAAVGWTVGLQYQVVSAVESLGVVAGGLAISQLTNAKSSVQKSAFLLLGGVALGMVANILPFTHILHQATYSVASAGVIGLVEIGVEKYKKRKI